MMQCQSLGLQCQPCRAGPKAAASAAQRNGVSSVHLQGALVRIHEKLGRNRSAIATGRPRGQAKSRASRPLTTAVISSAPQVLSHTKHDHGISVVAGRVDGVYLVVVMSDRPRPDLVLHWAINDWELPATNAMLPPGTTQAGPTAMQTPFRNGESVTIAFPENTCPSKMVFVLKERDQWYQDHGNDYTAVLKPNGKHAAPLAEFQETRYDEAGVAVVIGKGDGWHQVEINAFRPRPDLVLHWAVNNWQPPQVAVLPLGTVQAGDTAVQTPFQHGESVTITFPEYDCPSKMVFVLKEGDRWIKNRDSDFTAVLRPGTEAPRVEPKVLSKSDYSAGVSVKVLKGNGSYTAEVRTDRHRPNLVLHWAVNDWQPPPTGVLPKGTVKVDGALQTPFHQGEKVSISFPEYECPSKLVFVLKEGDNWINDWGKEFTVMLKQPQSDQWATANKTVNYQAVQQPELVLH